MDLASWGGNAPDGRTVEGHDPLGLGRTGRSPLEARLYDRLFKVENPGTTEGVSFTEEMSSGLARGVPGARRAGPGLVHPRSAGAVRAAGLLLRRPGQPARGSRSSTGRSRCATRGPSSRPSSRASRAAARSASPRRPRRPAKKEPKKGGAERPEGRGQAEGGEEGPGARRPRPRPRSGIEELQKIDLRVGVVRTAEVVAAADKLLRLEVDLGEGRLRQIFSGIRAAYPDPAAAGRHARRGRRQPQAAADEVRPLRGHGPRGRRDAGRAGVHLPGRPGARRAGD